MRRASFLFASGSLLFASAMAWPACVATETGNPPFTVEDESFVVRQDTPPTPGDPITTTIDAPEGSVSPATGQIEVRLLDSATPTVVAPVMPDGSFAVSFDEQGGERFRLLVRDGRDASRPIDAVAGFDGLTALPSIACVRVQPVVGLETTTVVIENECAFPVTRGEASWRLPTSASIEQGPLEIGAGEATEITVTGLGADNTLRVPLTAPDERLLAVTFLGE